MDVTSWRGGGSFCSVSSRNDLPPAPASSFASDNAAGVHPVVLDALVAANEGSALAYGADPWTEAATVSFCEIFDAPVDVAFCWGGTGANVVALQCLLRPGDAIVCPAGAHINVDECGAPERFTGAKLLDLPCPDGRLSPEQISAVLGALGDEHHVQPAVVSITQSTEYGTLYTEDQIGAICQTAHAAGLLVHVDGARIANAVAASQSSPAAMLTRTGVDVVSFGGTKNGMMYGEAVCFLTPGLADRVRFVRKMAGQLPSKMRYVSAQFDALLSDDLWLSLAGSANRSAKVLADRVRALPGVTVTQDPEVNAVFVTLERSAIAMLQDWSFFWDWDTARNEVRWMTSWATTEADIADFVAGVEAAVSSSRR